MTVWGWSVHFLDTIVSLSPTCWTPSIWLTQAQPLPLPSFDATPTTPLHGVLHLHCHGSRYLAHCCQVHLPAGAEGMRGAKPWGLGPSRWLCIAIAGLSLHSHKPCHAKPRPFSNCIHGMISGPSFDVVVWAALLASRSSSAFCLAMAVVCSSWCDGPMLP